MAEWIECKISDIGTVVGGATPSTRKSENYEGGNIAWITPKDLSTLSGRYIQRGERNITEVGLKSCSAQLLPQNTVLFSSRAPIGYVAIAANEVCTNQGFKSVVPNESTDPLFLFYLLKYNKDKIEGMGSGTTFKEVSGNTMKNIIVRVPSDKEVQRNIASMLGSIDDKIEENERINNNLYQQVQAIFTNMFVNNSSMTPATIADVALNVTDGVHNTVHDDPTGDYLLLSCKNIKGGSLAISSNKRTINKDTFDKLRRRTRLAKGDVLISSVGTVGELLLLNSEPHNYEFQRSVAIVKPNPQIVSSAYLFASLTYQREELINTAHGAVQQCLFISDIAGFPINIPDKEELLHFNSIVNPMFDIITANESENKRLSEMRDSLLPKLMSGEIDVSEVNI